MYLASVKAHLGLGSVPTQVAESLFKGLQASARVFPFTEQEDAVPAL